MSSSDGATQHTEGFRPPSQLERELLAALLDAQFPGRDELAGQLATAAVRRIDRDGSLEFAPSDGPPGKVLRRIPVEAELDDNDGVTIHLLLHVLNGFLKELEIYREDSSRLQRSLAPGELRLVIL